LQEEGVLWLQGKVIGGLGVVAEGKVGGGVLGSIGAGSLLLVWDGFAGLVTGDGPADFLAECTYCAGPGWRLSAAARGRRM
jgi:hypothetical protein